MQTLFYGLLSCIVADVVEIPYVIELFKQQDFDKYKLGKRTHVTHLLKNNYCTSLQ
jgi:hypothetical protein